MIQFEHEILKKAGRESRLNKIVRMSYMDGASDWRFSRHKHEEYCEIVFIAGGEGLFSIEDAVYKVGKGDIVVINPNTGHGWESLRHNPMVAWNLALALQPEGWMEVNVLLPGEYDMVIHTGQYQDTFYSYFRTLAREMEEQEYDYSSIGLLAAESILLLLNRIIRESGRGAAAGGGEATLAAKVKRYIEHHYAEELRLDQLANHFHTSKYYIIHAMQKYYQVSPIHFLIDCRLGEAQQLMIGTSLTIAEIARMVGYENPNYFNKLFHKRIGMSPSCFREQYRFVR